MQEKSFVQRGEKNDRNDRNDNKAAVTYINQYIKAPTIVVIDDDKTNLWSFSRRVALEMAEERWLDLIQIHYDPVKQVCTALLSDYGKYMYRKQKDTKEKKKAQKQKWLKELKISYWIWENDLNLKIKKWREFLNEWYNVKFVVKLRWREKMYEDKAVLRLKSIVASLEDVWRTQYDEPKKEARWYSIILFSKI